jgi:hypothetical protein
VLRRIFGPKTEGESGNRGHFYNEELKKNFPRNILRVIKLGNEVGGTCCKYCANFGARGNVYRITYSFGKPEGRIHLRGFGADGAILS